VCVCVCAPIVYGIDERTGFFNFAVCITICSDVYTLS
jgi:hypothetical protein